MVVGCRVRGAQRKRRHWHEKRREGGCRGYAGGWDGETSGGDLSGGRGSRKIKAKRSKGGGQHSHTALSAVDSTSKVDTFRI